MLLAHELRIGNVIDTWNIYTHTGMPITKKTFVWVKPDHIKHIYDGNDLCYEAVVLSPEILRKSEFDVIEGTEEDNFEQRFSNDLVEVVFRKDGFNVFHQTGNESTLLSHIEYLHQLQNFVYFYSGEELRLDL